MACSLAHPTPWVYATIVSLMALTACARQEAPPALAKRAASDPQTRDQIVFVRYSDTTWLHTDAGAELYLAVLDEGIEQRLTKNEAHDAYPAWSRDGKRMAFVSDRDNSPMRGKQMTASGGRLGAMMGMEVYVMSADGSRSMRVTKDTSADFVSQQSWSPDGAHVLVDSERDGDMEIYVLSLNGSVAAKLTDNSEWDGNAAWSPDGRQIAFRSNRSGEHALYVMLVSGGDAVAITRPGERPNSPVWSPNGKLIAYASRRRGNSEIVVMNADGSGGRTVTNHAAEDRNPSWSPDGGRLAFASTRDGNAEIYVINADGTGARRVTANALGDEMPTWRP